MLNKEFEPLKSIGYPTISNDSQRINPLSSVSEQTTTGKVGPENDEASQDNRDPSAWSSYGDRLLDTPLSSDDFADSINSRYRFEGDVISWGGAVNQYLNHRRGELASKQANGYEGSHWERAQEKCRRIHRADRGLRELYDNPTLLLITFAGQFDPTRNDAFGHPVDHAAELANGVDSGMEALRDILADCGNISDREYAVLMGGSQNGVPHFHASIWIDGVIHPDDIEPAVTEFVSDCEVASVEQNAVSEAVRCDPDPNVELKCYPSDGGEPVHAMARYSANQVPHLGRLDPDEKLDVFEGMTDGEKRVSAVHHALPRSVSTWRASNVIKQL